MLYVIVDFIGQSERSFFLRHTPFCDVGIFTVFGFLGLLWVVGIEHAIPCFHPRIDLSTTETNEAFDVGAVSQSPYVPQASAIDAGSDVWHGLAQLFS